MLNYSCINIQNQADYAAKLWVQNHIYCKSVFNKSNKGAFRSGVNTWRLYSQTMDQAQVDVLNIKTGLGIEKYNLVTIW